MGAIARVESLDLRKFSAKGVGDVARKKADGSNNTFFIKFTPIHVDQFFC